LDKALFVIMNSHLNTGLYFTDFIAFGEWSRDQKDEIKRMEDFTKRRFVEVTLDMYH